MRILPKFNKAFFMFLSIDILPLLKQGDSLSDVTSYKDGSR
nr:MAG TPA: hypothetical protein [Caudoviricetes sp.]